MSRERKGRYRNDLICLTFRFFGEMASRKSAYYPESICPGRSYRKSPDEISQVSQDALPRQANRLRRIDFVNQLFEALIHFNLKKYMFLWLQPVREDLRHYTIESYFSPWQSDVGSNRDSVAVNGVDEYSYPFREIGRRADYVKESIMDNIGSSSLFRVR